MYITKVAYVSAKNLKELKDELNKAKIDYHGHCYNNPNFEIWIEIKEDALIFLEGNYLTKDEAQQIKENEVGTLIFY